MRTSAQSIVKRYTSKALQLSVYGSRQIQITVNKYTLVGGESASAFSAVIGWRVASQFMTPKSFRGRGL